MRPLITIAAIVFSTLLCAQAPALIPYQAIARNAAGEPIASSALNARFTIHDATATGPNVWQEMQTVSTSALGLFTSQLGSSVPLTSVDWSDGAKFLQVELDFGNGFLEIGTQQLVSVPYALYAGNVHLQVSEVGDTLFVGDGSFVIVPGISDANQSGGDGTTTGTTLHTCGTLNVHNADLTYGSMTDQEGNVYKTIVIGTQEWMAENLNTNIYRNGDLITTGLSNSQWENTINTQVGAWAYMNDDPAVACPYGKLYNWFACVDDRQLCPLGWHIPSDEEWTLLRTYLGGLAQAGGKMKSIGTIEEETGLWYGPNLNATNSSGFSGLPGGAKDFNGEYNGFEYGASWWSSTQSWTDLAYFNSLTNYIGDAIENSYYMQLGLSVRCLRD
ncbi:MAG: fibrobacter succinogenes major paralogous domain-containing protein [Flavobacteriales bacterium]